MKVGFLLGILCCLFVVASARAELALTPGLGGGGGAANLPIVNPAIACDATTDNQPAIQAAINTLEALTAPGGVAQLPACDQLGVNSTILINSHNITLAGVGSGGTTGVIHRPSSYWKACENGSGWACNSATVLGALSAYGPMVEMDPANGGLRQMAGGVRDLVLAGQELATYNLEMKSGSMRRISRVVLENAATANLHLTPTSNTLLGTESLTLQQDVFDQLVLQNYGNNASKTANCILLDGTSTADANQETFTGPTWCGHENGIGVVFNTADQNFIENLIFFVPSGTSSLDLVFNGSNGTDAQTARYNTIGMISFGLNGLGVHAYGAETTTFPSHNNRILSYQGDNGAPLVPDQGYQASGVPILIYTTSLGLTNAGFQGANMLVNGVPMIDTRNGTQAVTQTAAGGYIINNWYLKASGIGNAFITKLLNNDGPFGNNGYSVRLAVGASSGTTPTAAQFALFCQGIEGTRMAALGLGTSKARNFTLQKWVKASVTGVISGIMSNAPGLTNGYNLPYTYTITTANVWQPVLIHTLDSSGRSVPYINAPNVGSWSSGATAGFYFCDDLGAGSNFQGTPPTTWTLNNTTFETTGSTQIVNTNSATIQYALQAMQIGEAAQQVAQPTMAAEVADTGRYFFSTFPSGTKPAQSAGVAGAITSKVPIALGEPSAFVQFAMPGTPTIVTYNPTNSNANWWDKTAGGANDVTVSVDPGSAVGANGVFLATSGTVTTLGDVLMIHITGSCDYATSSTCN